MARSTTPYKAARETQRGMITQHARATTQQMTGSKQVSTDLFPVAPAGYNAGFAGLGAYNPNANRKGRSYDSFKHWVYVAVNAIATRLAGQEITAAAMLNAPENPERMLSRLQTKQAKQAYTKQRRAAIERHSIKGYAQDLDLLPTHPSLDLLARPNDLQQQEEFIYLSAANLLITGVCYWIGGVNTDRPQGAEIWAVPSNWITPIHKDGLFTGYVFQPPGTMEPTQLDPENVQRIYLPDPSDLKAVYSPLQAILEAVRIDSYIQSSQEDMFERGIDPNLIITVGRQKGSDGRFMDARPVLRGKQRRHITHAVRDLWNGMVGEGGPAVIDGLIESVHKLSNSPKEMDWTSSGETVKKRIMQTYRVNPISVGEVTAGNRAQALEADKNFCRNAVNPLARKFSSALTDFIGPWYDKPKRLLLWIEDCLPIDEQEENKLWTDALRLNAISKSEFRQDRLGLPPDETQERNQLLNTVGGISAAASTLAQVGQGLITRDSAKAIFQLFFEITEDQAEALVGNAYNAAVLDQETPPAPPEDDNGNEDQGDEIANEEDDNETPIDGEDMGGAAARPQRKNKTGREPLNSESSKYTESDKVQDGQALETQNLGLQNLKASLERAANRTESEVAALMADFFLPPN